MNQHAGRRRKRLPKPVKDARGKRTLLKRFYADNYRCLVNFEFRPRPLNLLVGDNGAGKTAIVDAITRIRDVVTGLDVSASIPMLTLTRWERRNVQRFELEIEGNGGTYTYALEVEHDYQTLAARVKREGLSYDGKPLYKSEGPDVQLYTNSHEPLAKFPFNQRISFLGLMEPRPENALISWFKGVLSRLWIISLVPAFMGPRSEREWDSLQPNGGNFTSWYRHLTQEMPEIVQDLFADLSIVIPGFNALKLLRTGENTRELHVTMTNTNRKLANYDLVFDELSEGQRALVALYALLHASVNRDRILLFDEPDNFVSLPEIQPWLIRLSDRVAETSAQVFVISHNAETIDYLAAESALIVERPNAGPTRVRELEVDRETGLRASEFLARRLDK